jgi:cellulose synthase/poly-beta-1,6-N-acetylglucosamine synthase-like glycosyltransferase
VTPLRVPGPATPGAPADVTLVVPVRDEEASIEALATSIAAQAAVPTAVVFVDGGSTDRTAEILGRWVARHPSWRVLAAGPATPGRARNLGVAAATTEWIALTDAGIVLDPHWLRRMVEVARHDPSVDVVYGHCEPDLGGFVSRCAALAYLPPPRRTAHGPVRDGIIASCLVRRSAWAAVGGFPDLRAAEDRLFMRALAAAGHRHATAPEATVTWAVQPGLLGTFRRFRTYSRVNVAIGEQRHWHHGVGRQYLTALPFVLLGTRRRAWLAVPALGFAARTVHSVLRRREGRPVWWAFEPRRLAGVGVVVLTCDLATFAGWVDALRDRRGGRDRRREQG